MTDSRPSTEASIQFLKQLIFVWVVANGWSSERLTPQFYFNDDKVESNFRCNFSGILEIYREKNGVPSDVQEVHWKDLFL